jgi:aryl-alcohol dehydrogenase-like predicted oxidoreductase
MKNICLGTVQFGLDYGVSNKLGKPKYEDVINIVKCSLDNNINYFDTAQSYGDSEIVLGKIFEELNVQSKVNVITKLSPNFKLENVINDLKKSLLNLNINTAWGLLLHRFEEKLISSSAFKLTIEELKKTELIKYFGVSVYSPEDALLSVNNHLIDIIQVPFNILDRRLIDNKFFEIAKEKKKKIFIRSVYLQGLMLMNNNDLKNKKMSWAIPHLTALREFSKNNNLDIKSFALNAIIDKDPNVFIITGVDTLSQLKQNIALIHDNYLTKNIFDKWWNYLPLYPEKLLNPSLWKSDN